MPRGFCGCCSLYASTVVALTFTLMESSFGLTWNAQLSMLLDNKVPNLLSKYIHLEHLNDYEVVHGMTLASTGLHILWIVFVLLAFKGNATLTHGLLTPYVLLTYLITVFDIGGTIYFSIKFQEKFVYAEGLFSSSSGEGNASLTYLTMMSSSSSGEGNASLTYLTMMSLFSRGCLTWFINVYFAYLVEKRGKEIDENYSALTFYILSQLSRALKEHQDTEQTTLDSPPVHSANFMPQYILEATRDSLESSWSLNDNVQGIDANVNSTGLNTPLCQSLSTGFTVGCKRNPESSDRISEVSAYLSKN